MTTLQRLRILAHLNLLTCNRCTENSITLQKHTHFLKQKFDVIMDYIDFQLPVGISVSKGIFDAKQALVARISS